MPDRPHRKRRRFDPDERFNLPDDTDPMAAMWKLLGLPGPVKSHEEAEDRDKNDQEAET